MNLLIDGPEDSPHTLVLAHGAGGAMDSPFLNIVARGVGASVELDMQIARGILDHIGFCKSNCRQLEGESLHLGLIGLQLTN